MNHYHVAIINGYCALNLHYIVTIQSHLFSNGFQEVTLFAVNDFNMAAELPSNEGRSTLHNKAKRQNVLN